MRIFEKSLKNFKDPSFSCQDLQGSSKFLSRSLRIFHFPFKILEDLDKNFEDPLKITGKFFEKLLNSCSDL